MKVTIALMTLLLLPAPALSAQPTVKLLSAGKGAKKKLRYMPKAGTSETMVMTMKMKMAIRVGEQRMPTTEVPPITMTIKSTVKNIDPKGLINYAFVLSAVDVTKKKGIPAEMVRAMQVQLGPMKGLKGKATVTSRGFNQSVDLEVPKKASKQVKDAMANLRKSMQQLASPLPAEPVGAGAQWEVEQRMVQPAITMNQKTKVTLVSLSGNKLKLKFEISQTAPRQKMSPEGMPPGVTVELLKFTGSGTGTASQQLTRLVPLTAHAETKLSQELQVKQGEQLNKMEMDMELVLDQKTR